MYPTILHRDIEIIERCKEHDYQGLLAAHRPYCTQDREAAGVTMLAALLADDPAAMLEALPLGKDNPLGEIVMRAVFVGLENEAIVNTFIACEAETRTKLAEFNAKVQKAVAKDSGGKTDE